MLQGLLFLYKVKRKKNIVTPAKIDHQGNRRPGEGMIITKLEHGVLQLCISLHKIISIKSTDFVCLSYVKKCFWVTSLDNRSIWYTSMDSSNLHLTTQQSLLCLEYFESTFKWFLTFYGWWVGICSCVCVCMIFVVFECMKLHCSKIQPVSKMKCLSIFKQSYFT